MLKKIKLIILALIFCGSAILLSGCALFKTSTTAALEKTCCQECVEFVAAMPGTEKCLANENISQPCQEFFIQNPTKEEACLAGKIATSSDVVIPTGEPQNEETAAYYEFKKKYEHKKWRGTINGESNTVMVNAGTSRQIYTVRIEEMKFIFNGPDGDPALFRNNDLIPSIELSGKAVLVSAHISITCGELNVEVSSFPFNLAGGVNLSENTINFDAAKPERDQEFKVFYVATCDPGGSWYGDNEVLWNLFKPSWSVLKFDQQNKIILSAASEKGSTPYSSSTFKITGELAPF